MYGVKLVTCLLFLIVAFGCSKERREVISQRYPDGSKMLIVVYEGSGSEEKVIERLLYNNSGELIYKEDVANGLKFGYLDLYPDLIESNGLKNYLAGYWIDDYTFENYKDTDKGLFMAIGYDGENSFYFTGDDDEFALFPTDIIYHDKYILESVIKVDNKENIFETIGIVDGSKYCIVDGLDKGCFYKIGNGKNKSIMQLFMKEKEKYKSNTDGYIENQKLKIEKEKKKVANNKPTSKGNELLGGKTGTVQETLYAAGYTYIKIDFGDEVNWVAAPQFAVKVGDDVVVPEGMPMPDYHSRILDRTFDVVYFVPNVLVGGAENIKTVVEATVVDLSGITVAEGGQTVADIFAKKTELAGKPVKVRGKVVKFTPKIMGKNWINLQDGTGATGTNDLKVTTSASAKAGDTVVISGILAIDKDFGYGYPYDVIVEDAKLAIE